MADFVSALADHVDDDVILTTLAELERGRLFEWDLPEARVLVDSIRHTNDWSPEHRERYRELLQRRPSENVETLLERATDAANLHAQLSPQRFAFAINRLFVRIAWRLHQARLGRFLAEESRLGHASQTFVSFNYDLVLDRSLQRTGVWTPATGYGFPIREYVDTEAVRRHAEQFDGDGGAYLPLRTAPLGEAEAPPGRALILKPHGSLNWLLPFAGNYAFEGKPLITVLSPAGEVDYLATFDAPQILSDGAEWPRDFAPFVVPPSRKKNQIGLRHAILEREREAIRHATVIYVIGWSLPDTDGDQLALIEEGIAQRRDVVGRLTIVNRAAGVDYYKRVQRLFEVDQGSTEVFNRGLQDFVDRQAAHRDSPDGLLPLPDSKKAPQR